QGLPRTQFIRPHITRKRPRIGPPRRRILVIPQPLPRHDPPFAIPPHPRIGLVIARLLHLPKDDFSLIQVIAKDGHIALNMAPRVLHLDRPRRTRRQPRHVGHQRLLYSSSAPSRQSTCSRRQSTSSKDPD